MWKVREHTRSCTGWNLRADRQSCPPRLLPEEIASVFRDLQDQAPPVAMGKIRDALKKELGTRIEEVSELDPEPCAAASIGQIHRARLRDGRDVVFKVQYPGIDKTIASDMKNLKGGMKLLLSWFTRMDTELIWKEVRDRLLHVDPNLANFSFREDGGINVDDFGCVKEVPDVLADGYARLAQSMLSSRYAQMPAQLKAMGIVHAKGRPVSLEAVKDYAQEVRIIFRKRPPYR